MEVNSNDRLIEGINLQNLKEELENRIKANYPNAYYLDENNVFRIKDIQTLEREYPSSNSQNKNKEGRGGNNIAENIKKSLKSTIKAKLGL